MCEGAKNMIRALHSTTAPAAALADAHDTQVISQMKMDLIRMALDKYGKQLPSDSPKRQTVVGCVRRMRDLLQLDDAALASSSVPFIRRPVQSLAVTGRLEVRLIGCLELAVDIPGRPAAASDAASTNNGGSISTKSRSKSNLASNMLSMRRANSSAPLDPAANVNGLPPSSTTQPAHLTRDASLTDDVYAMLRVDHRLVGRSDTKPVGRACWEQSFAIELAKARELEIDVYWNDRRAMCAFTSLKLGDFIDSQEASGSTTLPLEPHGALFVEFRYLNPVVSRKPKLQRQQRLFHQKREPFHQCLIYCSDGDTDELTLMGREMGARTFGRLMKTMIPTCHDSAMTTTSPPAVADAFRASGVQTTTTTAPPIRALYQDQPHRTVGELGNIAHTSRPATASRRRPSSATTTRPPRRRRRPWASPRSSSWPASSRRRSANSRICVAARRRRRRARPAACR